MYIYISLYINPRNDTEKKRKRTSQVPSGFRTSPTVSRRARKAVSASCFCLGHRGNCRWRIRRFQPLGDSWDLFGVI